MVVEVPVGTKLVVEVGLVNNLDERLRFKMAVDLIDQETGTVVGEEWHKETPAMELPGKRETTQVSHVGVTFDKYIPLNWVDKKFGLLITVYDPEKPARLYAQETVKDAFVVRAVGKEVTIKEVRISAI